MISDLALNAGTAISFIISRAKEIMETLECKGHENTILMGVSYSLFSPYTKTLLGTYLVLKHLLN